MTLKRITTRYLQSHREITIELPEKGLIGFYGDNSNGKSVIVKATDDIVKNNLTNNIYLDIKNVIMHSSDPDSKAAIKFYKENYETIQNNRGLRWIKE